MLAASRQHRRLARIVNYITQPTSQRLRAAGTRVVTLAKVLLNREDRFTARAVVRDEPRTKHQTIHVSY